MRKAFRLVSAAIFVFGLLFTWVAYQSRVAGYETNERMPATAFTLTAVQSHVYPDGSVRVVGWRTRYVTADGQWRIVEHALDHAPSATNSSGDSSGQVAVGDQSRDVVFGNLSNGGVYGRGTGGGERVYFGKAASQSLVDSFHSKQFLRSRPGYVRTEQVLGLEAFVLRKTVQDLSNKIEWIEESYSPKTGFTPLRTVDHLRDGSEIRIDTIDVRFGPVPENLNADIESLPDKQQ